MSRTSAVVILELRPLSGLVTSAGRFFLEGQDSPYEIKYVRYCISTVMKIATVSMMAKFVMQCLLGR